MIRPGLNELHYGRLKKNVKMSVTFRDRPPPPTAKPGFLQTPPKYRYFFNVFRYAYQKIQNGLNISF